MKNNKLKKILITLIVLALLAGITLMWKNYTLLNNETLIEQTSIINKQNEISRKIEDEISSDIQLYVDPFEISPLTALLTFKTEMEVEPTIVIKGQYGSSDIIQTFEKNKIHILPIYGLYANSSNEVTVTFEDQTEEISIQTNPLPHDFNYEIENIVYDENYASDLGDDFYFVTPASSGYTAAYDINGNVRWYLTEKLVWEIKYLKNGNLTLSNEQIINPPYYTTGFYEMSMTGKIYKEYILPGGYHHDLVELPNGNFIVASNDFDTYTVEDVIVEIDEESGEITKIIDLKDILPIDSGKSENWINFDWFHNNSVFYDEKTNSLILSGRHQDIVVSLDYDTLQINYIIGDSNGFDDEFKKYFLTPTNELEWPYAQHAAKVLPNGNIFIFDNGINRSKYSEQYIQAQDNYSRGVIYDIDSTNMTITQVFEYGKERGSEYFSSYVSDVDYLDDNHYLIHSGGVAFKDGVILNEPPGLSSADELRSYTSEVKNGKLIFEVQLKENYYRAEKMNIYNSNKSLSLTPGVRLGNLNSTEITKEKLSVPKVTSNQDILDEYNVNIEKLDNRLSLSGSFKKEDKVSIILYKNYQALEYKVRISDRPYTAMCIVIFDDKLQTVNTFINNDDNLNGEYAILISINGITYSTNKNVSF